MDEENIAPFAIGQTVRLTEEGLKSEELSREHFEPFVVTLVESSSPGDKWIVFGHKVGGLFSDQLELVPNPLPDALGDLYGSEERKLEDWPEGDAYAEEVKAANEELIKALRVQNKSALREAEMWRKKPNTVEAHRATEAVCDTGLRVSRAAVALIQVSMVAGEESQRWLLGATQSD